MTRPLVLLLFTLALGIARDRSVHAQGAAGLPDPISSAELADALRPTELVDQAEDHESLMAGPVDRYQAAFQELRNGPIEDWLEARRGLRRGFMTTPTVDEAREEARDRRRLLARIAELDAVLFQALVTDGLDAGVVDRAANARRRDRALATMGRRYARSLRLDPMEVLAATRAEMLLGRPDWNVPPTVREILEAYERERTTRMERLSRLAMKIPVGVAERLSKLAPDVSDPSTLQPEDFDQWFADRRAANASAKADAIRELESIKASEEETLRAVLGVAETDPVFAAAFESNWNPTTIMPGSPIDFLPPVGLGNPEEATVIVDGAEPIELDDSVSASTVIVSVGVSIENTDLPEGISLPMDMGDFEDDAIFIDAQPGFGMTPLGLDTGIPAAMDPAEFKAACSRLALDETARSIADILFREYREAYSVIAETLVADWKDTPRNPFGLGGSAAATERDLDRAAGLRLAILDEIIRIDEALFTDLAVMLEDGEAVDREIRRRGRTACLETSGATGDGIHGIDLELIADDSLDPRSRAMVSGLLDEWSAGYGRALEEWTRRSVRLDRDDHLLQAQMMKEALATTGGAIEIRVEAGGEGDGADFNEMGDRMMSLAQERLAIEAAAKGEMQDWIDEITPRLEPGSRTTFRLQCEKAAWPSCFRDPRSPQGNFERALGLEDLDQTTRLAIETLEAEWRSNWVEACRKLVEIARSRQSLNAMMSDPEFDPGSFQKSKSDRDRIRFDRDELDERAMRDLKALLSPEDQARIGDLPDKRKPKTDRAFPIDLEGLGIIGED